MVGLTHMSEEEENSDREDYIKLLGLSQSMQYYYRIQSECVSTYTCTCIGGTGLVRAKYTCWQLLHRKSLNLK